MRVSTFIASLTIALLPSVVVADWAETRDLTKLSGCGLQCSSLLPEFANDAFDDICNKLVEDGYVIPDYSTRSSRVFGQVAV